MVEAKLAATWSGQISRIRVWFSGGAINRRKLATAGAALLALGVAYHVVFGPNGLTVYMGKRHETRALETEMKQLQGENDALKGHVERLQSDPGAIEHEARQDLHYTRPGEVIYTLGAPAATNPAR